jgi:hypothetical protein
MSRSGGIFREKLRKLPDEGSSMAPDATAARDARKEMTENTPCFPVSFFIYDSTSVADCFAAATISIPRR